MKKMLNYIANGKGIGLKYFTLFSILVCILCWFIFSSVVMKNTQTNEHLNQFFSKGKIDLRGYDANILDVDAYDSFINECPDEEDSCEADIEDADFELKNR